MTKRIRIKETDRSLQIPTYLYFVHKNTEKQILVPEYETQGKW